MNRAEFTIISENETETAEPFSWVFLSFKNPSVLWNEHWFALILEITGFIIISQILRHAKRKGHHAFYLVLAAMFAPMGLEILTLFPCTGYKLWWYHQGVVNVFNQRLPSYVMTWFAIFHYIAHNVTENSKLPALTRSIATAIVATLLHLPCLWLGPKLLLSFLHFDDEIFQPKLLEIPYQQILVVFLLFFHTSHLYEQNFRSLETFNTFNYTWCFINTGLVSGMYAIIEQYNLYMLLTLILKLHPGFCLPAAIGAMIWLSRKEIAELQFQSYSLAGALQPLKCKGMWGAFCIMLFTSTLPLWLQTGNLQSNGERLELGQCQILHEISNTSPLKMTRRRYVCPEDATHLDFDFHCVDHNILMSAIENHDKRYTICGKPMYNYLDITNYTTLYSTICMILFYSFNRLSFHFNFQESAPKSSVKMQ